MTTVISMLRKKMRHFSQFLATLAVSLGPFAAGMGKGYSSPAMASLRESHSLNVSGKVDKWLASLSLLGAMFGCLAGGFLLRLGRRKSILIVALPFAASWLLTILADQYLYLIFGTSFFGGFCSAIILLATQVYVSEISHPDIRGLLSFILKMATHLGTLVAYSLGAVINWRELAMVAAIPPILLFIAILPLPETPSFLLYNDKDDQALKSFQWLRSWEKDAVNEADTEELDKLKKNIKSKPKKFFPKCSSQLVQLLLITCGLMATQKFSGVTVFPYYAVDIFTRIFRNCSTLHPQTESYVQTMNPTNVNVTIFKDHDITHNCNGSAIVLEEHSLVTKVFGISLNAHGAAITAASIQFFGSMASGLVIDSVGRIPLLVISNIFISISYFVFGLYDWWEDNQPGNHPGFGPSWDWIPLTCVIIFTLFSAVGIGSITQLMVGEIFPLESRNFGGAVSTCFGYFVAFIAVNTFVDISSNIGLYGAFWIYTGVSVAGLIFIYMCVPETRGELEEMELPNQRRPDSRQSVLENHGSLRNLPFRIPCHQNSYTNMISEPDLNGQDRVYNYNGAPASQHKANTNIHMNAINAREFRNPAYQHQPPEIRHPGHQNIIAPPIRSNGFYMGLESFRRLRGTDV